MYFTIEGINTFKTVEFLVSEEEETDDLMV